MLESRTTGLWLKDPADARDPVCLALLLARLGKSDELIAAAHAGKYRVVPNTFDNRGGCFVMFGRASAPGEKKGPTLGERKPGFLQRLFRQDKPKAECPSAQSFKETIACHLKRLSSVAVTDTTGTMKTIVSQLAAELDDNLMGIYATVQQTDEDNQSHSWAVVAPQLLLVVSAIPCSLREGLPYFAKASPPGYLKYLDSVLSSGPANTARSSGVQVMAHVILGTDASVDICIVPLTMSEEGAKACPCPAFPLDLLSAEERRRLGVGSD